MRHAAGRCTVRDMSYAMTWHVGDGPRHVGRIEVGVDAVELTATSPGAAILRVAFAAIRAVVLDRRVLIVTSDGSPELRISSIDAPGSLRELADRVSRTSFAANPVATVRVATDATRPAAS
jgi:hypothetical protein